MIDENKQQKICQINWNLMHTKLCEQFEMCFLLRLLVSYFEVPEKKRGRKILSPVPSSSRRVENFFLLLLLLLFLPTDLWSWICGKKGGGENSKK